MYYLWDHLTTGSKRFFKCSIEDFEGCIDIPWITGEKVNENMLPSILRYKAHNKMMPNDFPFTGSTEFLVSNKIVDIVRKLKIPNVDYFDSEIVQSDGNVINGYKTLNIMNMIKCLDEESSKFIVKEIGGGKSYRFKSLVLHEDIIPEDVRIFRLGEQRTLVIVDEKIKEEFEKANVTGVLLTPVVEGDPVLGRYIEY